MTNLILGVSTKSRYIDGRLDGMNESTYGIKIPRSDWGKTPTSVQTTGMVEKIAQCIKQSERAL